MTHMTNKNDYLIIIQARLNSTRLPNKAMLIVGGLPMVKRVWDAAYDTGLPVKVAWPERYPDLDENNVLERFRRISNEFPSKYIIRLTADCPLLDWTDIFNAIVEFQKVGSYYSNHIDGKDVQIFTRYMLMNNYATHKEHVIDDFETKKTPTGPRSVDTWDDLEYVRNYVR